MGQVNIQYMRQDYLVTADNGVANFSVISPIDGSPVQVTPDVAAKLYAAAEAVGLLQNLHTTGGVDSLPAAWNSVVSTSQNILVQKAVLTGLANIEGFLVAGALTGGAVTVGGAIDTIADTAKAVAPSLLKLAIDTGIVRDANTLLSNATATYTSTMAPGSSNPIEYDSIVSTVNATLAGLYIGQAAASAIESIQGVQGNLFDDILDYFNGLLSPVANALAGSTGVLSTGPLTSLLATSSGFASTLGDISDIQNYLGLAVAVSTLSSGLNDAIQASAYTPLTETGQEGLAQSLANSPYVLQGSSPSVWSIASAAAPIHENAGSVTFEITRSDSSQAATIYVSTVADRGTTNSGDDTYYQGRTNIPIYFAAGDATESFTLTINDLNQTVGSEAFRVIAQQNPTDPVSTWLATDTFTIVNSDSGPVAAYTISPSSSSVSEHAGVLTFTITRSDASQSGVIYVSTVHDQGTENPGGDTYYDGLLNYVVKFAPNQTSASVSVVINDLGSTTGSETFRLIAQQNSYDPITTTLASTSFTIFNNDQSQQVTPVNLSGANSVSDAAVVFSTTQTLEGGVLTIGNWTNGGIAGSEEELVVTIGATLTLGPNLIVDAINDGLFLGSGAIVNQGTITADGNGTLSIEPASFTNQNVIAVLDAGTVVADGLDVTNAVGGTITVGANSNFTVLAQTGGSAINAGTITVNGSGAELGVGGVLDNTNGTIVLTQGRLGDDHGSVEGGTIVASSNSTIDGMLDGVTVQGELVVTSSLTIADGITLTGAGLIDLTASGAVLNFSTTTTLDDAILTIGNATDNNEYNADALVVTTAGTTLTLGANLSVDAVGYAEFLGSGAIVNQGTITADGNGTLSIEPASFTNQNVIAVLDAGTVVADGLDVTNAVGGTITVGANSNFTVLAQTGGSAINAGTITVNGSGAELGVGGVLDNTNGTIVLTQGALSTGNGSVHGGTIVTTSNSKIGGTLDDVTVQGPLVVGSILNIANGITLTGADGTGPGSIDLTGVQATEDAVLNFSTTETLDNATLTIGNTANAGSELEGALTAETAGTTLTLGSNLTIAAVGLGWFFGSGAIVNQGSITADGDGNGVLWIDPGSFTNQGVIEATGGGSVVIGSDPPFKGASALDFTNAVGGTITIGANSGVSIQTLTGGTSTNSGTITLNGVGAGLDISGVLDNTNGTIVLTQGALSTGNGSVHGGTIVTTSNSKIGGTLDDVTVQGPLVVGSILNIANGITLTGADGTGPGSIDLTGVQATEDAVLNFSTTETLDNATLTIGNATDNNEYNADWVVVTTAGTTLTLGASLSVDAVGYAEFLGSGAIVNQGTITADGNDTLWIDPASFTNQTVIIASNGGSISIGNVYSSSASGVIFTNAVGGAITIDANSDIAILGQNGGSLTNAGTITINGYGAELDIGGDLYNTGTIIAKGPTTGGINQVRIGGTITGNGQIQIETDTALQVDKVGSGGTLVFTGSNSFLDLSSASFDSGGAFDASITGFGANDTIELKGLAYAQVGTADFDGLTDKLSITEDNTSYTLKLTGNYAGKYFHLSDDGSGGTDVTEDNIPCFCRGTMILTSKGEVAVENLRVGDAVITLDGKTRPVVWIGIGRSLVTPKNPGARPVIVRKDALAFGAPSRDLYLTKAHSLYFDDVLIPVEHLINGRSILWDMAARVIEYYHIELPSHDVLIANGAPSESYFDGGNRDTFLNSDRPRNLPKTGWCAPVLTDGPLVEMIWKTLLDRSGFIPPDLTDDADLHLMADGVRIDAYEVHGEFYRFLLRENPFDLRIVSRHAVPREIGRGHDMRQLGVAISSIGLRGTHKAMELGYDSPILKDGFHSVEDEQGFRWTDGNASVPGRVLIHFSGSIEISIGVVATMQYPDTQIIDAPMRAIA